MIAPTLADTSALYALLDRSDTNHDLASIYYLTLPEGSRLTVIEYVLLELMTLLRARGHSKVAVEFREQLEKSDVFTLRYSSAQLEAATFRVFRTYEDKDWSYTDCALLATAQQLGTSQIFSFDHHISQMGIIQVPQARAT